MATNDGEEHSDSKPSGINKKYDELERVLRKLPPATGGKESVGDYLDGKSDEEE